MSWTPRYHHVSQYHRDNTGWNDCAEASLARYLLEAYPTFGTDGEWALIGQVLDPKAPQGVLDIINRLREIGTNQEDQPTNPFTTAAQIDAMLTAYGIQPNSVWDATAYNQASNYYWALCNVDCCKLSPQSYPPGFVPASECGQANHLILWLPALNGMNNYFNDPLTWLGDVGNQVDVQYDLTSVRDAFVGAWLLPSTKHGEDAPAPPPAPPKRKLLQWKVKAPVALNARPDASPFGVCTVAADEVVVEVDSQTPHYQLVRTASGVMGFVLRANLEPAP